MPPFTEETAILKVRAAENAWNKQDPEAVSLAYTPDTYWRNRDTFVTGRAEVVEFLTQKWARELDYRLIKELWASTGDRLFHWDAPGPRPEDHPGLTELGL
nr:DUF1348 family protein [Streptomyces sp. SID13031]